MSDLREAERLVGEKLGWRVVMTKMHATGANVQVTLPVIHDTHVHLGTERELQAWNLAVRLQSELLEKKK